MPQGAGSGDTSEQQTLLNDALNQVDQQKRMLTSERERHTADLGHHVAGVKARMLDELHQQASQFEEAAAQQEAEWQQRACLQTQEHEKYASAWQDA